MPAVHISWNSIFTGALLHQKRRFTTFYPVTKKDKLPNIIREDFDSGGAGDSAEFQNPPPASIATSS